MTVTVGPVAQSRAQQSTILHFSNYNLLFAFSGVEVLVLLSVTFFCFRHLCEDTEKRNVCFLLLHPVSSESFFKCKWRKRGSTCLSSSSSLTNVKHWLIWREKNNRIFRKLSDLISIETALMELSLLFLLRSLTCCSPRLPSHRSAAFAPLSMLLMQQQISVPVSSPSQICCGWTFPLQRRTRRTCSSSASLTHNRLSYSLGHDPSLTHEPGTDALITGPASSLQDQHGGRKHTTVDYWITFPKGETWTPSSECPRAKRAFHLQWRCTFPSSGS